MSVEAYYTEHFAELPPEKQFHLATRLKSYLGRTNFDDFLAAHQPSTSLTPLLNQTAPTTLNHYNLRQPFLQKYPKLYGLEAALFRVLHLLQQYQIDLRPELEQLYPTKQLYALTDQLLADPPAVFVLSSYAINTICLTELLFPRGQDVFITLAALPVPTQAEPALVIYYYTHLIICDSSFYTRPIPAAHLELYHSLLSQMTTIIQQNYTALSLDIKLEYLVCCNLANFSSDLRPQIAEECQAILATSPYLIDPTRPPRLNTLAGAEHRNALFILSGLDA